MAKIRLPFYGNDITTFRMTELCHSAVIVVPKIRGHENMVSS